jgi:integrase
MRRDVLPILGGVPIAKVRHTHARALMASLTRRRLSPATISLAVTVARGVLGSAVRDGLLVRDPLDGLRLPAIARRRVRYVPPLADVVRAADTRGQAAAALTVLAGTGLRASELAGLDVTHVDFLRRTATVKGQVIIDRDTKLPYYESTKSPDGMREIPLPTFVLDALAAWLAKRPARTLVLPVGGPDSEQTITLRPVFGAERGDGPMTQDSLSTRVAKRSRRIGVESFGPHSLRHRYTTVLHDAKVPLAAIDAVTGHAPAGVSLAVYTEVTAGALAEVREAIQAAWEEAVTAAVEPPFTHFSRITEAPATR